MSAENPNPRPLQDRIDDLEADVELLLCVLEWTLVALAPEKSGTIIGIIEEQARKAKHSLGSAPMGPRVQESALSQDVEMFERASAFVRFAGEGRRK